MRFTSKGSWQNFPVNT